MGDIRYDSRQYVIVIIETDAGITGSGFGMTRGSPVASIVNGTLAAQLVGRDPLMIEQIWDDLYYRNLPMGQRGIFMRASSAVDIALWDIKGRVAGMPVWRLLGGHRQRVPIVIAGGYPAADRTMDDLARELAGYVERGIRTIKIAAGDLREDSDRLAASRAAIGPDVALAYDAHWAWRDLVSVVPTVARWDRFDLSFIEDPFPSERIKLASKLRAATGIPLALGEDVTGRWAFRQLLAEEQPDVLRVDATVAGGFSEAARICALASSDSVPVLPHVFPEIHVHLAAAYGGVLGVEMTDPAEGTEALYRLFRTWVRIDGGEMLAPEEPGIGLELDPDALERFGSR
jgi:L-alanine-DL-glutamate epimerase-like enolase superfamily enzyme